MTMHTPPECQGQTVETSYGWSDGCLYMRVHDRSDRSDAWYIADEDAAARLPEDWHPANGAPRIADDEWTPCQEPQD